MEQKAKKYDELNRYERAMTNASLEQRIEAMANDLAQMSLALKTSIHVDATFHNWEDAHSTVSVSLFRKDNTPIMRRVDNECDLLGIIEESQEVPVSE